jgi:glycosyltransferase involved in cell wall biosynthesis
MPDRLQQWDVLVLPSLTRSNWKEQFGRILVEAMACQVPVVASNSGEIPNVVGDAGLLVPEGDPGALRDGVAALLDEPARRLALGQAGRARVLARYTHRRIAEQTAQVYCQVTAD